MNIVFKLLTISFAILCCSTIVPKQQFALSNTIINPSEAVKNPQSEPGGL